MKKYKILKTVMLNFYDKEERADTDYLIHPNEGIHIECDGSTIWLINKYGRHESITQAHYVEDTESFEEIVEDAKD